jgi:hypothetical protein
LIKTTNDNPFREARAAVLAGKPIPATTSATLESRGVDVGALEQRIKEADGWRH